MIEYKLTDLSDDDNWTDKKLSSWVQDTEGWLDEKTGEYYPPTFAWIARITAVRRSDGVHFYQQARISGEEGKPLQTVLIEPVIAQALEYLDTFAHCACQVDKPCGVLH